MAQLDRSDINNDITYNIFTNIIRSISGNNVKQRLLNFSDSFVNILSDKFGETTKDISGLTVLDLTGVNSSIIILTSTNATETLNQITNYRSNCEIILRPESGLNLTINDAAISSGNIHLNAPSIICFGTKKGFLKVHTRESALYQEQFIDQYN